MQNTPFSSMGRAMMAEQQRSPNPQQQPSPAQQAGLVSLESLLRMQAQLNYLKGAVPQKQQPHDTVAQDIEQQLGQAEGQGPAQEQGLGALPAENVGSERAYAAGGIVAFDDGGSVKHFEVGGLTAAEEAELYKLEHPWDIDPATGKALGELPSSGVNSIGAQSRKRELQSKRDRAAKEMERLGRPASSAPAFASSMSSPSSLGLAYTAPTTANAAPPAPDNRPPLDLAKILGNPAVQGGGASLGGSYKPGAEFTRAREQMEREIEANRPKEEAEYYKRIKETQGEDPLLKQISDKLAAREAGVDAGTAEKRKYAKVAAWAKGLEAVSRPGQAGSGLNQLLGGFAPVLGSYSEAVPKLMDQADNLRQALLQDQLKIADAKRREDVEAHRDARAEQQRHVEMYTTNQNNLRNMLVAEERDRVNAGREDARYRYLAGKQGTGLAGLQDDLAKLTRQRIATGDTRLDPVINQYQAAIYGMDPRQRTIDLNELKVRKDLIEKQLKPENFMNVSKEDRARLQAELNSLSQQIASGGGAPSAGGGVSFNDLPKAK